MNREVISDKQAISIAMLFLWGSTIVIGTGSEAKKDMWIAIIIAMIMGILISFVYSKILYLYPFQDIFEINELVFGKLLGKIISSAYIIFTLILGALVLDNFTEFISTVGLPDTPRITPVIFIVILCIWVVKEGIEVMGRWSEAFVFFIFFLIILTLLLATTKLNLDNIRPVLENGIKPVIKGGISAFAFPFGESVIFIMFFSCLKERKSSIKVFVISMLGTGITLALLSARNVMVLGGNLLSRTYFPSYAVVARINIGDFIQRIETAVMVAFMVDGFIKVSCCLLAACKGVAKIFNFNDYRFLAAPIGLMIFTFSFKVYNNIIETVRWVPKVYYIFAFPFEVMLPVITLICAEFKIRKNTKEKSGG